MERGYKVNITLTIIITILLAVMAIAYIMLSKDDWRIDE
jgi:LPS O-antigen subunit length determinant protein (WzzB/FepE family)